MKSIGWHHQLEGMNGHVTWYGIVVTCKPRKMGWTGQTKRASQMIWRSWTDQVYLTILNSLYQTIAMPNGFRWIEQNGGKRIGIEWIYLGCQIDQTGWTEKAGQMIEYVWWMNGQVSWTNRANRMSRIRWTNWSHSTFWTNYRLRRVDMQGGWKELRQIVPVELARPNVFDNLMG